MVRGPFTPPSTLAPCRAAICGDATHHSVGPAAIISTTMYRLGLGGAPGLSAGATLAVWRGLAPGLYVWLLHRRKTVPATPEASLCGQAPAAPRRGGGTDVAGTGHMDGARVRAHVRTRVCGLPPPPRVPCATPAAGAATLLVWSHDAADRQWRCARRAVCHERTPPTHTPQPPQPPHVRARAHTRVRVHARAHTHTPYRPAPSPAHTPPPPPHALPRVQPR